MSKTFYQVILAISLLGLVAAVALGVVFWVVQGADEETPERSVAAVKERAPDFTLALLGGGTLKYADLRGRPIFVNFFASWCLPCHEEMPAIVRIAAEYQPKGVVFVGVAVDDTEPKLTQFVAKHQVNFPVGLDEGTVIQKSFGLYGLPTSFFIDKQGVIKYFHSGAVTEELLRHEIDQLL